MKNNKKIISGVLAVTVTLCMGASSVSAANMTESKYDLRAENSSDVHIVDIEEYRESLKAEREARFKAEADAAGMSIKEYRESLKAEREAKFKAEADDAGSRTI